MYVLGITHPISLNPAACLLRNGDLVAFAEEERFVRLKHAPHLHPHEAIRYCLDQSGLSPADIDITAVGFDRPNSQHAERARAGAYVSERVSNADWFEFNTSLSLIHADTQLYTYGRRVYADHHLCHAASAAIPSGFPRTNFITLDAWGGRASGLLGVFDRAGQLEPLREIPIANSWGMTYELITAHLGFRSHSGEGKTMGLASYGEVDSRLLPDFCDVELGLPDVRRFEAYVTRHLPRRRPGVEFAAEDRNLAATLQYYYERSLVRIAAWLLAKPAAASSRSLEAWR